MGGNRLSEIGDESASRENREIKRNERNVDGKKSIRLTTIVVTITDTALMKKKKRYFYTILYDFIYLTIVRIFYLIFRTVMTIKTDKRIMDKILNGHKIN